MNLEERIDFYEKLYFHELDVKEKLDSKLKMPLTIFAVVFTMAIFLLNQIFVEKSFIASAIFWLSYTTGWFSLGFSIVYFVKSWYGYNYKMLPIASRIEEYYLELKNFYEEMNKKESKQWHEEAFDEYLLTMFKSYSSHNTVNNDRKNFFLYRSITSLIIAFSLIAASYLPYYNSVNKQRTLGVPAMSDKPEPPPPPPPRDVRGEPPKTPTPEF